ncbi:hypothetical protein BDR26DRAFT_852618 [Obelidium mucronatum]|nr:hypothetical protein BDR26DRAFT_852618 [Obelidium mucronatum]
MDSDNYDSDDNDRDRDRDRDRNSGSRRPAAFSLALPSVAAPLPQLWNPMAAPIVIAQKPNENETGNGSEAMPRDDADADADAFDPASLRFSNLFAPRLKVLKPQVNKKLFKKPPHRHQNYVLSRNDIDVFLGRIQLQNLSESWGIYRGRRLERRFGRGRDIFIDKVLPNSFDPIVIDSWEDKILWDDEDDVRNNNMDTQTGDDPRDEHARLLIRNTALDRDDWTDSILWDDEENFVAPPIIFNDPTIVNDLKDWGYDADAPKTTTRVVKNLFLVDKYNLSNDQYYVNARKHEEVRQTQGNAILKHSRAAIEMMFPHYKTHLNTQELRNFHRPPIKFSAGEEIKFARVKGAKKKKDGTDPISDYMNLTLKDSTNYVLLEYTEEYPPIMSNFGMGTMLQNFYRKQNEKDLTTPKLDIGQHTPLEKIDASPFNNFGDVSPGQVIQGITNNLIRAPVFRHEIPSTDFLLIRYTYNNKSKYYLRDCPFLFVVGQTYPQQEVPRPQSRKVLNLTKFRLHSIAFRLMLQNPNQRLWYPKLQKFYIGQSDALVRQRLREVAQNWKKGENTGWYKVKQSKTLPTEEELQKIITPECSTDLEIQMAPWISTKNFVMTISGKGMVQLHGGGDPTGCGEGFSFIRQSMKEMFYREGEAPPPSALKTPKNLVRFSYAEQQVVYKEEIRRIWNAQFKSLSSKKAPDLPTEEELGDDDDDVDEDGDGVKGEDKLTKAQKDDDKQPRKVERDDDAMSIAGSIASASAKSNRKLVIKRLTRMGDGQLVWKHEVISDQRVINAYLRHQVQIREQALAATAGPTEEDTKKSRKKKLPDQVITDTTPAVPGPNSASAGPLKLKLSLSSIGFYRAIFDMIVSGFIAMPESQIFCSPVSRELFPDYHVLVKTPICLEDIKARARSLQYKTADQFSTDVTLIYENSALVQWPQSCTDNNRFTNEIAQKATTSTAPPASNEIDPIDQELMDLLG